MKIQVALIAAALFAAAPAAANEARVETRIGTTFGEDQDMEVIGGVAAGYDIDIGGKAFIGAEGSVDKLFVDDSGVVLGGTARLGLRQGPAKLYLAGGYSDFTCDLCGDAFHAGAGVDVDVTTNVYGKVEYRHFFLDGIDSNVLAAGLGLRF